MSSIDAGAVPARKVRRFFRRVNMHFEAMEQELDDVTLACRRLLDHSRRVQQELTLAGGEAGEMLELLGRFAVPSGSSVAVGVVEGDRRKA